MSLSRAEIGERLLQLDKLVERFIEVSENNRPGPLSDRDYPPEAKALDDETKRVQRQIQSAGAELVDELARMGEGTPLVHVCIAVAEEEEGRFTKAKEDWMKARTKIKALAARIKGRSTNGPKVTKLDPDSDVTRNRLDSQGVQKELGQPRKLSRVDLPVIIEGIRELYRAVLDPPKNPWTPPAWLVKQYDKTSLGSEVLFTNGPFTHSALISAAEDELLDRLTPPWRHMSPDCPEITRSNLDQNQKVALIRLRDSILTGAYQCDPGGNEAGAILYLGFLEEVLKALDPHTGPLGSWPSRKPSSTDRQGSGDTSTNAGFFGAEKLADFFGVDPSRRVAFVRKLDRQRSENKLSENHWRAVDDPRPKEPRFLYDSSSLVIRQIAKGYLEPN